MCRHNNWKWAKGRLADDAATATGAHHQGVWAMAEQIANHACRAPIADDVRHGCHILAFGRDVSHTDFTNPQFSRLLLLWGDEKKLPGLLINPLHVRSLTYWDHPEMQQKESLIFSIKAAAPDAYIEQITQDVWGTAYWEDLDVAALLGLLRKIKGNRPSFQR